MLKPTIIKKIHEEFPELSAEEANKAVSAIFTAIIDQMASGGRVEIRGFGVFETRQRMGRKSQDPRNGEPIEVPAKTIPFFRAGMPLKKRVDEYASALKK